MQNINFIKMHGCGNDFVIIDKRKQNFDINLLNINLLCDRRFGIGCDQLIIINNAERADCYIDIYNPDATRVQACGNATRCVAKLMMAEKQSAKTRIETVNRILLANKDNDLIAVNMGKPLFSWQEIPTIGKVDTENHILQIAGLQFNSFLLNMGNPHAVLFVNDIENCDVLNIGPIIENNKIFPERINVNFAQIINKHTIKLRVWERGAGETMACGSGACASLVAANKRGLTSSNVQIKLKGGIIKVKLTDLGDVIMTGDANIVFKGSFTV